MEKTWIAQSLAELNEIAAKLLEAAKPRKKFAFYGEMGSGKTTLIQALCLHLGISRDVISSPTFSIVNEYRSAEARVFHFDVYRINSQDELFDIGYEEYFFGDDWVFVEWAEKIPDLIPDTFCLIHLNILGNNAREFRLTC